MLEIYESWCVCCEGHVNGEWSDWSIGNIHESWCISDEGHVHGDEMN